MTTVYKIILAVVLAALLVIGFLVVVIYHKGRPLQPPSSDQETPDEQPLPEVQVGDPEDDDADRIPPHEINAWAKALHEDVRHGIRREMRRLDEEEWRYMSQYLQDINQVDEAVRHELLKDLRQLQLRHDIEPVLEVLPLIRDPEVLDYYLHAVTRAGFSGKDWDALMNALVDMTHDDEALIAGVALIHAVKWPLINNGWSPRAMDRFADIIHGPPSHLREVAVHEGFNMAERDRYADMHDRVIELSQSGTWRERRATAQIIARWRLGDTEALLEALVQDEHASVSSWAKTHLHFVQTGNFVLGASVGVSGTASQRHVQWPGSWARHDRQGTP